MSAVTEPASRLSRRLGTFDAVVIGLGSMIGAGVFAAIGPAAAAAGGGLLIGLAIAAVVAYCNATSSAQLAALYPESGGTYVYGRRPARTSVGLPRRLGLRHRQDRQLRGDGAHLRRLRQPGPRPAARDRGRRRAHRREPARRAEDRVAHPGHRRRGPCLAGHRGRGRRSPPSPLRVDHRPAHRRRAQGDPPGWRAAVLRLRRLRPHRHPRRRGPRSRAHDPARHPHRARASPSSSTPPSPSRPSPRSGRRSSPAAPPR